MKFQLTWYIYTHAYVVSRVPCIALFLSHMKNYSLILLSFWCREKSDFGTCVERKWREEIKEKEKKEKKKSRRRHHTTLGVNPKVEVQLGPHPSCGTRWPSLVLKIWKFKVKIELKTRKERYLRNLGTKQTREGRRGEKRKVERKKFKKDSSPHAIQKLQQNLNFSFMEISSQKWVQVWRVVGYKSSIFEMFCTPSDSKRKPAGKIP